MQTQLTLPLFIEHEREGSYFTLPFTMPGDVETLTLRYHYPRRPEHETRVGEGILTAQTEVNVIDLGLVDPHGSQVGASGADKTEISLSETQATPGYHPCRLVPGEWGIIVGAYHVAPEGVTVTYELSFTLKSRRLLKGDLHAHTLASDGVHTVEELGWKARRSGLDFLAITDHNQAALAESFPLIEGLTLIPGLEWTHYQGHANFLGVDRPYDAPFFTNTSEEARARFASARQRGAFILINHPYEETCPFRFDLTELPFDGLEVWNGPMREANFRSIGLWQSMLVSGKKIPACGGSDYHHDTPFIFLGGPTTCVLAESSGVSDILAALRQGHAFITFAPDGPTLEMSAGEAVFGDTVSWPDTQEMRITASGLLAGDVIRVVTRQDSTVLLQAPAPGRYEGTYRMAAPGFARVEILRAFLPGLPMLPALLSNPIYFEGASA